MYKVIVKYVGGHPRICISFIFCRQSLDILEEHGLYIFWLQEVALYHCHQHWMQGIPELAG
jgi:hypothetical protein